jgi:murein DD-endopeptidase MepM/ murein hydrolase activator NlpD
MWMKSAVKGKRPLLIAALLVAAAPAIAQSLYKYRDADGFWVYSDRQPGADRPFERLQLDHDATPGIVRLYQRTGPTGTLILAAENSFHGAVQIAFNVIAADNLDASVPVRGNRILPARSDTDLLELLPARAGESTRVDFEYQFIHGSPAARHNPATPYRLPYALASSYRVSQAFPDTLTHIDTANSNAIDFEMPVGTDIFAARAGIVINVASDFFEAGLDPSYAAQANIIRILHEDGTMALYAHLNWNSIRVEPGQRVSRGAYIADSGNTGFSSGPHLHFVVQRNSSGAVASVAVEFAGPNNEPAMLKTGDDPIAR